MKSVHAYISKNLEKILLIVALILSIASVIYCYQHDLITLYSDARGHLNIARRVYDNLTPGLAQLGGVWLPLLHILLMPTIWINFMWSSGISGSIVGIPMYILTCLFVYKTVYLITGRKLSGLLSFLVISLNINLLYLQSTPMTEALFIATLTISVYLLTVWLKNNRLQYLLGGSVFVFLTSINRYEGWIVAMGMIVLLVISKLLLPLDKKITSGKIILFSSVALLGIILWLIWQLVIFHNPMYFLNSDFSAKGQTLIAVAQGQVPTYKNIVISVMTVVYSILHVDGIIVFCISLLGIIFTIHQILVKKKAQYFLLPALWIPAVFTIYALYKGNVPMNVPEFFASGAPKFFNVRYAIYSLPAISIFIGILPIKKTIMYLLVLIAILVNSYLLTPYHLDSQITVVEDAVGGELAEIKDVVDWMRQNYDEGYILASAATNDPVIFSLGINMNRYITEGSGKYWEESIENPSKYAKWVIIADSERDMVKKYIIGDKFFREFEIAQVAGIFTIYKAIK